VGPRTGLDDVEKRKFLTLPCLELRPLCSPARSQSLYRLSYPGSETAIGSSLNALRHNLTGDYTKTALGWKDNQDGFFFI
jgi:hypothetical protein